MSGEVCSIPVGAYDLAIVDDEDYLLVTQGPAWQLKDWANKKYAFRRITIAKYKARTEYMHTLLTGFNETDHINGDGLDNRRCNLREVTHAQNLQSQKVQSRSISGYRGVSLFRPNERNKPWRARIKICGIDQTLGYFKTPEEAALCWNQKALEVWGEYAFQNKVPQERR